MIYSTSRYARATVFVDEDGRKTVFLSRRPRRTDYPDNELVTVSPGMTLFNLAEQYGLGAKNWWVIAEFNGILDVTALLTPGTTIKIPSRRTIQEVLFQ